MLRPATPLSIILLVAFVLLLLSTLSTPTIKAIPLANFQGYNFGVFGYCKGNTCSGYKLGYNTDGLFSGNGNEQFSLPSGTRHSLSAILIVHPIAAFLTLVCFGLAVAAHFHSPAHSSRYLLGLLILTIPTLLVTLLAFLVDILLFVPHMAWGGWIVLAATILIVASSVVTCAMRRTLVSRKARKKRIAENSDMNGQNYYENLGTTRMMQDEGLARADSPPPLSGSSAVDAGKVPQYATFETLNHERKSLDDRTPLNPRNPSVRSASTGGGQRRQMNGMMDEDAPPMPNGRPSMDNGMAGGRRPSVDQYGNPLPPRDMNGMGGRRPSVDQYGNPLPPRDGIGMASDLPPPGLRHQNSRGSLSSNQSNRSGGPPPMYGRGRGGYPQRGYGPPRGGGYGPPRGPMNGYRGGPQGMRGGRGGPSPGMMAAGAGAGMAAGAMMGRGQQRGPPPGYDNAYYQGARGQSPGPPAGMVPYSGREPSPGPGLPIGQAIEMDERTGSPPNQNNASPTYGLRDSDADVAGMVGLQQGMRDRNVSPIRQDRESTERVMSPSSTYSDQTYVPPRNAWAQPGPLHHQQQHPMSPDTINTSNSSQAVPSSNALPLSPIQASPRSPTSHHSPLGPQHTRAGSESYYEDVDPRFATDLQAPTEIEAERDQHTALPSSLMPGQANYTPALRNPSPNLLHPNAHHNSLGLTNESNSTSTLDRDGSMENIAEGARSPAGSEASHFTSVSQRGVNPNWRPPPGSGYGGSTASANQRRREDVVLAANPDFSLPGVGGGRGGRGGFRGRGMGMPRGGPMAGGGLTPQGRYPTDMV